MHHAMSEPAYLAMNCERRETMTGKLTSWRQCIGMPLICGVLGMAGCAGKPPLANLSQADLAVQEAEKKTASQYAPLDLQTAREQLNKAKRAMDDKKYEEARRLADQALVNAQLAEAKAGAEKARQAAAELQKSIQMLRAELQSPSTGR
jgi:predicted S18 family serine protease